MKKSTANLKLRWAILYLEADELTDDDMRRINRFVECQCCLAEIGLNTQREGLCPICSTPLSTAKQINLL